MTTRAEMAAEVKVLAEEYSRAFNWNANGWRIQQKDLYAAINRLAAAPPDVVDDSTMRDALIDMLSGWRYIRQVHGDLYGVGWDRAQEKAEKALGLFAATTPSETP